MSQGCCQECNDEPPCLAPVLEFISVSADCELCGFSLHSHAGLSPGDLDRVFRYRDSVQSGYSTLTTSSGAGYSETNTYNQDASTRRERVLVSGTCTTKFLEGAYLFESTTHSVTPTVDRSDHLTDSTSAGPSEVWSGTETYTETGDPDGSDDNYSIASDTVGDGLAPTSAWSYDALTYSRSYAWRNGTMTEDVIYSGEVTSCDLTFPSYPSWESDGGAAPTGDQGYLESAENIRSGISFAQTKIKYRVRHLPTGTCYLKVWISTVFTPTGGSPGTPVITSYEWTGSGNPCIAVTTDPVDAESQKINSTETEVAVPSTNGETQVVILKWSCVSGYEPDISDDENPQPNGFPDPSWEASPP